MKRAHRILSILLAASMLLPSQALAADIAPKSQTQQSSIVINEVESDAPNKGNDWVEITNIGAAAVDISGWYLTDDKGEERKTEGKTTPLAEGTVLDPGAFLVLEETVNFDFGLGKADKAAIYDAGGNLIVEYEWTTHANGVYARIPANGYLVIYQDDSGAKGFAFGLGKGDSVRLFEDGEQLAAATWPDGSHTSPTWGLYPDVNGRSYQNTLEATPRCGKQICRYPGCHRMARQRRCALGRSR